MSIEVPFLQDRGFLIFLFQFSCHELCSLIFNDVDEGYTRTWLSSDYPSEVTIGWSNSEAFSAGVHNFTFSFYQSADPIAHTDRSEEIRITMIDFIGTATGGASSTYKCPEGSFSNQGTETCDLCGAGQQSTSDRTGCITCPGNSFNPVPGGTCIPCGSGTTASADRLSCINTCSAVFDNKVYQIDDSFGSTYYVSRDGIYYYVNPCRTSTMPGGCTDDSGNVLNTHGCAINYNGGDRVIDIGSLVSYQAFPGASLGVRVQLSMGGTLPNCASPGNTTIDVVCDPLKTYGSLELASNFDSCNPSFVLASVDACPLCTSDNYQFYYTECYNNSRTKVYQWKEPRACHGGVVRPANEEVPCSTNTHVCDIGYVLNSAGDGCVACGTGGYSLGGGHLVNQWTPLPDGFRTECTSAPCTKWSVNSDSTGYISGYGTSSLVALWTYRRTGAVVFTYQLFSTENSHLKFYLDGILVWSQPPGTNNVRATQQRILVNQIGTHEFKWTFHGGTEKSAVDNNFVDISQIFFENVDYHADSCSPCPAGSRPAVPSVDPELGCSPCARNTYTPSAGFGQCLACSAGTYQGVPGQTSCDSSRGCNRDDYKISYSTCSADGTRQLSYVLSEPYLCSATYGYQPFTPPAPTRVPCAPCPAFSYRNSQGACVGCALGQHFDATQQKCIAGTAGGVVRRTANYFYDGYPTVLTAEFKTGCEGECYAPAGWRVRANYIDSGRLSEYSYLPKVLDSYLAFSPTLAVDGSISFNFSFYTTASTTASVYFLLDGLLYPLNLYPVDGAFVNGSVVIPVTTGAHKLEWNIHQSGGEAQLLLSNLAVVGSNQGDSASEYVSCPPGTYSRDPTDLSCTPCAAGHYNSGYGATSCTPCPTNTYSSSTGALVCSACEHGSSATNPGSQTCTPNCQFKIGEDSYSLQSLQSSVTVYDTTQQRFDISVCGLASNCLNSHVCFTNASGTAVGAGSSFRVIENTDNTTYSNSPFSVHFEHGAPTAACPAGTSALVDFECNPFASASLPVFVTQTNCTSIFFWQSQAACHVCTDDDYQTVVGSCAGGRRYRSKTIVTGCNGPTSIPVTSEDCSSREIPTGAIIAIVIVFVALVAVSVAIYVRNRYLYSRYTRLLEMDRFTNDKFHSTKNEKDVTDVHDVNSAVL